MLDVLESLSFLKNSGFPVINGFVVSSKAELVSACKRLGFPIVMKIVSAGHKTDLGGVITGVNSSVDALKAFNKLRKLSGKVLVQSQSSGIELVLGINKDPVFGQVIMFGLGGVFVEVLRDVSFRVCPVSKFEALSMINELRGRALLEGYRGKTRVDVDALAGLIVKLSELSVSEDVKELDVNPLFAEGSKFSIVDARLSL